MELDALSQQDDIYAFERRGDGLDTATPWIARILRVLALRRTVVQRGESGAEED
jgi:hypothetical protein